MNLSKEMIAWKPIIIGVVIALLLYLLSSESLTFIAFLLAGIAVGYMLEEKY
jgi:ABC-type Fe3+-siderophore transport system permease subunit